MKRIVFGIIIVFYGVFFSVFATPLDVSLLKRTGTVDTTASGFVFNGDSAPVESLYLEPFSITHQHKKIQFDLFFHWDEGGVDFGRNHLDFRLFLNGQWQDLWMSSTPYDLWQGFEPDFGDDFLEVTIDLNAYIGNSVAMGWSYITDGPEASFARISNVVFIPEPSLIFVNLAGLFFLFMMKRRSF